jgi:uncharacterized protein YacL (UPF0231 family)
LIYHILDHNNVMIRCNNLLGHAQHKLSQSIQSKDNERNALLNQNMTEFVSKNIIY